MKKICLLQPGIFVLLFLTISSNSVSQVSYNIIPESSKMTIQGTSSMHNWEMEVTEMEFTTTILINDDHIKSIGDTWFSCKTTSIVSDYALMDKKTYEALKAEEYSTISFRMTNDKVISPAGVDFVGNVKGYLSVAGRGKEIDIPFQARFLSGGDIELKGEVPLKMSDFDIDPPSALMGALKTGDEVWISYLLKLGKDNSKNTVATMNSGSDDSE